MKPMYWSLAFGPTLLHIAGAAESESSKNGAANQLGHIVVLKPDLETKHIDNHIDWVNGLHKGVNGRDDSGQGQGIEHTYRSEAIGFHGYSGKFSDEVLKQIKEHEHVDFVEENQEIRLEPVRREEGQGDKPSDDSGKEQPDKVDTPPESVGNQNKPSDNSGKEQPDKVDTPPDSVGNKNKNPAIGLLTTGQGYNAFLEKGKIVDAVIWPNKNKRDETDGAPVPAGNETSQAETVFDFTPPTTEVKDFNDVNATEYFKPPKPNDIKDRVAAKLNALREEKKKKKEEKGKLLARNETQTPAEDPQCPGTLSKEYKFTEDYDSYLKLLGISGGATISGWGQSASLSGNYLNQAKFSQNSLTYVAFLDVQRQLTTPGGFEINKARYKPGRFGQDFGNRWVHGGKMIARVTFTSKDDTKSSDTKAHAEASLRFWGIKGDLTADVKKSMEQLNENTSVDVSLFYQGQLGIFMGEKEGSPKDISSGSAEAVLGQVKSWAEKFESIACKHDYAYGPLLDEYETVPGFNDLEDSPEVPDYDIAQLYALEILAAMVKIEEQKKILSSSGYLDDKASRKVSLNVTKMIIACKKWAKSVEKDPETAEEQALELIERLSTHFVETYSYFVQNSDWCDKIAKVAISECFLQDKTEPGKSRDCTREGENAYEKCKNNSAKQVGKRN
ncbi:hypothetical protein MY11210_008291 [Beauveria gryllotalpidicola]